MNRTKKSTVIFLALALICMSAILGACDSGNTSESDVPSETTYKVTVKNALGAPYSSGIVVKFLQNGEQIAMQPCDANGVAAKTLASGDYIVELAFTDGTDSYYYESGISLSAEKAEVEVVLAYKITSEPQTLYVSTDEHDAYTLSVGCTYTELSKDSRNYFIFAPTESGTYRFTVVGNPDAQIGYYGAPHFVQSNNAAEVTDNSFTLSVSASMIGTGDSGSSVYVIGVDVIEGRTDSCIIAIERTGEAEKTIEDEPWTVYKTTVELSEYKLPENAELKEFDLTSSSETYDLVLNESDGFYHIGAADGPLVLVRLAEDCDYIACFQTILDRSGVSRYFFDEDGKIIKKESYSECLLEYIEYVDESEGVYPLTEDLKYIIQQRGEYVGWWNPESESYLFVDANGYNLPDINNDIAWLLMCCYIEAGA